MAVDLLKIWNTDESHLFLNPRLFNEEKGRLTDQVETHLKKSTIWLKTSGSTSQEVGQSKLVALSKSAMLSSAARVNQWLSVRPSDIWLASLPEFHVGGLAIWARAALGGQKVVRAALPWEPEAWSHFIESESISLLSLVPTQIHDLVQSQIPAPGRVRAVFVGGGAISQDLLIKAMHLGWPLLQTYGMTETCSMVACAALSDRFELSQKLKLHPGIEAQINCEGFIGFKGECLFDGYLWVTPESSEWQAHDPQEFFWTKDYAVIEGESLHLLGRHQDFAKVMGENINLLKLDHILQELLDSSNCKILAHAVAIQHPRRGEEIVLVSSEPLPVEIFTRFNSRVLPFERASQHLCLKPYPLGELQKFKRNEAKRLIQSLHSLQAH